MQKITTCEVLPPLPLSLYNLQQTNISEYAPITHSNLAVPMKLLSKIQRFLFHTVVHVTCYVVPRTLFALFVRLPVTAWEILTGQKRLSYSFGQERTIRVITATDPAAREHILQLFGLSKDMKYHGPMYSGHIHTVLGASRLPRRVKYEREELLAKDGNPICLDWLKVPSDRAGEVKGVVLLIPGLGNYGQTNYVQRFSRACVRRGFHCCILTPRGTGSAPLTTPSIVCVTSSSDVEVTFHERFTQPKLREFLGASLPVVAVGFSAGGSVLIRAVQEGKLDSNTAIAAALCFNAPYDMPAHSVAMRSGWGKRVYEGMLLTAIRKYFQKHRAVFERGLSGVDPSVRGAKSLPAFLQQMRSLLDFEEYVVAPHFGYDGAAGYHADGSSLQWAQRAAIPLLCVAARDDPIVGCGASAEDWGQVANHCPLVVYTEMPSGGHLSFLGTPTEEWREQGGYLVDWPISIAEHVVSQKGHAAGVASSM